MKKCFLCLVCLLALAAPVHGQEAQLRLNTAFSGPVRQIFEAVMTEACNRLGLAVSVETFNAERALRLANNGRSDGDGPRIAGLSATYSNLIQVPEKIIDVSFSGFSRDPGIPSGDWAALNPYRVGILIGWKILENNITGARSLRKVDDIEHLFKMLANDRVDLVVINEVDGRVYVKDHGLSGIEVLSPPFARREMFLYLHNRHDALVPELVGVLAAMKTDGAYQRIVQSVLGEAQTSAE